MAYTSKDGRHWVSKAAAQKAGKKKPVAPKQTELPPASNMPVQPVGGAGGGLKLPNIPGMPNIPGTGSGGSGGGTTGSGSSSTNPQDWQKQVADLFSGLQLPGLRSSGYQPSQFPGTPYSQGVSQQPAYTNGGFVPQGMRQDLGRTNTMGGNTGTNPNAAPASQVGVQGAPSTFNLPRTGLSGDQWRQKQLAALDAASPAGTLTARQQARQAFLAKKYGGQQTVPAGSQGMRPNIPPAPRPQDPAPAPAPQPQPQPAPQPQPQPQPTPGQYPTTGQYAGGNPTNDALNMFGDLYKQNTQGSIQNFNRAANRMRERLDAAGQGNADQITNQNLGRGFGVSGAQQNDMTSNREATQNAYGQGLVGLESEFEKNRLQGLQQALGAAQGTMGEGQFARNLAENARQFNDTQSMGNTQFQDTMDFQNRQLMSNTALQQILAGMRGGFDMNIAGQNNIAGLLQALFGGALNAGSR